MSRPIRSFDVFDTLIARRSVDPTAVFRLLEARAGVPGLAAARLEADRLLGGLGRPYQLAGIWQEVARALDLDATTAERLLALEIQIEHEEVIPVVENLALVRDGDLLVSDTYLPAEVVRSLLRHAGLDRQVGLVVSNDGKFRGWIWPLLVRELAIGEHFGDNPHSDGKTAAQAGLKAVIYTGAALSPVERLLVEHGWPALANLVREVRLANPFPDSRPAERHLWLLACQLNFPLLVFASLALERYARAAGLGEVLFVSRDCLQWHHLHRHLFPGRRSAYLYASRLCLLKPSAGYLKYFRSVWRPDSVIVDVCGTGVSWASLFGRLQQRGRCFFIGRVDDYTYLPGGPLPEEWLQIDSVFRNSEMGGRVNKAVEMINYAPHPSVEDVRLLPGGVAVPVLAERLEYDASLPEAAQRAFRACVQRLGWGPELPAEEGGLGALIRLFAQLICADGGLPAIYAGHREADLAYERRIRG